MKKAKQEPVMGSWRDAWGKHFTSPVDDYKPGQFSPTGSQLIGLSKKKAKAREVK